MILGSLVGPDSAVGRVGTELDDRLGKAFLDAFVTNEKINEEIINNPVIMKELTAVVSKALAAENAGGHPKDLD